MSVYHCAICDECKDADVSGCNEHRTNDMECICDDCYMYSDPEFACFNCNQANKEVKYCKITDQYYHDKCI